MEPTNWERNKKKEEPIVAQSKNYRNIIALIIMIFGTLVMTTGAFFAFGLPVAIFAFGLVSIVFGLALGFSKE